MQIMGDISAPGKSMVPDNLAINKRSRKIDRSIKGYLAYLGSVINSSENCSQEIKSRLRLERTATEELGKITKNKDVSPQTNAKIIHMLIFPITMYGCKRRTVKRLTGK